MGVISSTGTLVSQQNYSIIPANNPDSVVYGLASADVNGDGIPDLVVASGIFGSSASLTVLLGSGNGNFTVAQTLSVPAAVSAAFGVTIDDVNGDGKPDLVAAAAVTSGSGIDVFVNNGSPTAPFPATGIGGPMGASGSVVISTEFTTSGRKDLALNSGQILLGNGDGTYNLQPQTVDAGQIAALAAGSLRNNGTNDVVFAWADNSGNGHISVALGNGNGTFQTQTDYAVPGSGMGVLNAVNVFGNGAANGMVLADVNGDSEPDIVFISSAGSNLSSTSDLYVMLNNGNGTFGTPQLVDSSEHYLSYVAAKDLTGNGDADIVVTAGSLNNMVQGSAYLYMSNGNGTFQSAVSEPQGSYYAGAVAVADVNGDGKPDLIFAGENQNMMGGNVVVLLGNGNGTFQSAISTAHPVFFPSSVVAGGVTTSGYTDVILGGCCGFNSTYVLPGNGNGTFETANAGSIGLPTNPVYLKLLDVNGDGIPELFAASSGNGVPLAINVLVSSATSFSLAPTSTTLMTSAANIGPGQSVTFTATVTPQSGTGVLSGSVNFLDGTTSIGSGTLNGSGVATLTISSLTGGTHSITASYGGSGTFAGSVSSPALSFNVADFSIGVTALSPANSTISPGQSATYTVTVTPIGGFTGTVSLSCSNVPQASTCMPNTSSVTPSGASSATDTLTVTTTAQGFAPRALHIDPLGSTPKLPNLVEVLLLSIACLWFAARKQRSRLAASGRCLSS